MNNQLAGFFALRNNKVLVNGVFLIGNTILSSLFGFFFWVIGTRLLDKEAVGLGAAYISALTLLTSTGEMGLGTALIRFAPTSGENQNGLINSTLTGIAGCTALAVLVFLAGVPVWSPELSELAHPGLGCAVFTFSTLVFALGQAIDRVYVAFQAAPYLFIRNASANLVRILLMLAIGAGFGANGFLLAIGGGALASIVISLSILLPRTLPAFRLCLGFQWKLLRDKIRYSLGNHVSLFLWNAPPLVYPLVVVNLMGAEANAHFYIGWMIANILYVLPTSFSTSVFANASSQSQSDDDPIWKTMALSLLGALPGMALLMGWPGLFLSLFGRGYAIGGEGLLFWLALSVIPYTVNSFIIIYYRIHQDTKSVILVTGFISLLALVLVILMGKRAGLPGVGIGWGVGQSGGALFALVYYLVGRKKNRLTVPYLAS
jgi:O-antigen/teichoic acid export membrane protein